jgi:hypothetical protein
MNSPKDTHCVQGEFMIVFLDLSGYEKALLEL